MENKRSDQFAICKVGRGLRGRRSSGASLLKAALAAIAIPIWWQWHHPDPAVAMTLLSERNLAAANVSYFLFAFGPLGSTLLVASMLQRLFGHRAGERISSRG